MRQGAYYLRLLFNVILFGLASFPGLPVFFCSSVSVENNTQMWKGGPSASVYYCQRKPKNRKNGVGLGTRLIRVTHILSSIVELLLPCCQVGPLFLSALPQPNNHHSTLHLQLQPNNRGVNHSKIRNEMDPEVI